jgi:hypothetical protein
MTSKLQEGSKTAWNIGKTEAVFYPKKEKRKHGQYVKDTNCHTSK